jgi:hypothetical protein
MIHEKLQAALLSSDNNMARSRKFWWCNASTSDLTDNSQYIAYNVV